MKKTYKAPSGKPEDNIMYFDLKLNKVTKTFDLDYHFLGKQIKASNVSQADAEGKLKEVEKDMKQYVKTPFLRCFSSKIYIEKFQSFSSFYYSDGSKETIDKHDSDYVDPVEAMERFKANQDLALQALGYEERKVCCL